MRKECVDKLRSLSEPSSPEHRYRRVLSSEPHDNQGEALNFNADAHMPLEVLKKETMPMPAPRRVSLEASVSHSLRLACKRSIALLLSLTQASYHLVSSTSRHSGESELSRPLISHHLHRHLLQHHSHRPLRRRHLLPPRPPLLHHPPDSLLSTPFHACPH